MREEEEFIISSLLQNSSLISLAPMLKTEYFVDSTFAELYEYIRKGTTEMLELSKITNIPIAELLQLSDIVSKPSALSYKTYSAKIITDYKERMSIALRNEPLSNDELILELQKIQTIDLPLDEQKDISQEFLEGVERRMRKEKDINVIPTGYYSVDRIIEGFKKSELIIVGGRPAMGKSTIALNIAYKQAKQGNKVLFVSLEMSKTELHERIVKSETNTKDFSTLDYKNFEAIVRCSRMLDKSSLMVEDNAEITIESLETKVKLLKEHNKIDILYIDHIGILNTARYYNSRYEKITEISRKLKVIAKKYDIPVVAVCQLGRGNLDREIKAPQMQDLRDSGALEQDANIITFIHRPEYYLLQAEPDENANNRFDWEERLNKSRNKGEFIVSKNRRGLTGKVDLFFNGATYTFSDLYNGNDPF